MDISDFEKVDSIPVSAKGLGYRRVLEQFMDSDASIMRKKTSGKAEVERIRCGLSGVIKRNELPVKVHVRGDYVYLERTDKE